MHGEGIHLAFICLKIGRSTNAIYRIITATTTYILYSTST